MKIKEKNIKIGDLGNFLKEKFLFFGDLAILKNKSGLAIGCLSIISAILRPLLGFQNEGESLQSTVRGEILLKSVMASTNDHNT